MKLKVHSIHFDADKKLIAFVEEKVDKLLTFFDHIIDGEVYLKLDKAENSKNKIAEIKLHAPGKTLFAKEQCVSFEEATDLAVDALRKQLSKHKEKVKNL
ncbi:MAG: ribosome-associated translation inhibitor RaiA [Bacteroidia bacterium]|nr:ribosome-associated translation inhibitor RaiA [Bacteroidia bacterium]HQV00388.1 ribosome-associated translation inhibitor RaiA [Bacteroidia bacterium]